MRRRALVGTVWGLRDVIYTWDTRWFSSALEHMSSVWEMCLVSRGQWISLYLHTKHITMVIYKGFIIRCINPILYWIALSTLLEFGNWMHTHWTVVTLYVDSFYLLVSCVASCVPMDITGTAGTIPDWLWAARTLAHAQWLQSTVCTLTGHALMETSNYMNVMDGEQAPFWDKIICN